MNSSIALIQHEKIGMLVAVDINSDGEACLPTAGGRFIGVCQSPMPEIGQAIPVNIERCIVVESGGVYAAGDYLAVDAAGKFVASALNAPTNTVAFEASIAAGDRVQIIRL